MDLENHLSLVDVHSLEGRRLLFAAIPLLLQHRLCRGQALDQLRLSPGVNLL